MLVAERGDAQVEDARVDTGGFDFQYCVRLRVARQETDWHFWLGQAVVLLFDRQPVQDVLSPRARLGVEAFSERGLEVLWVQLEEFFHSRFDF